MSHFFEDIHISDATDRELFVFYCVTGDYTKALAILRKAQFVDKATNADTINAVTGAVMQLETLIDPHFKDYRIKFTDTLPPSARNDEVFFEKI